MNEKENPTTASEWIAQIAEGPLTSADKAALTDWLRESPRHIREFFELTLLQEDLRALELSKDQLEAWVREARDRAAIPMPSVAPAHNVGPAGLRKDPPEEENPVRRSWSRMAALAASILVALTVVGGYFWWSGGRYATGFGEQKIITLADGSVVTLNTSSELKVDLTDHTRALRLIKGEAFFRVAHDPSRPFEVTAQDATVKAVGTQFNVRIAPTATIVSVLDGAVEVRDRDTPKPETISASVEPPVVRLAKGEEARIARNRPTVPAQSIIVIEPELAAVARSAAWIKGRVEFEDTPLVDVLNEFRRYREFTVDVEQPLRELKLTGSFDAQDPESAFAYIETLPGVVVERPTPQTFIVRQE